MLHSAQTVVVGVDGSKAAVNAACWAVDEATSRDVPLRLVYVIEESRLYGSGTDESRLSAARSALYVTRRAIEASGKPVRIETQIVRGRAVAKLVEQSRSAAMICVGSIGLRQTRKGVGSTASALAASALCSVAVIRRPAGEPAIPTVSRVVVHGDDGATLQHAFAEARLRRAPLQPIAVSAAAGRYDAEESRLAHLRLSRRMARWVRLYPDVRVEAAIVGHNLENYLAATDEADQLFVGDSQASADLCGGQHAGRSVLAVRSSNL